MIVSKFAYHSAQVGMRGVLVSSFDVGYAVCGNYASGNKCGGRSSKAAFRRADRKDWHSKNGARAFRAGQTVCIEENVGSTAHHLGVYDRSKCGGAGPVSSVQLWSGHGHRRDRRHHDVGGYRYRGRDWHSGENRTAHQVTQILLGDDRRSSVVCGDDAQCGTLVSRTLQNVLFTGMDPDGRREHKAELGFVSRRILFGAGHVEWTGCRRGRPEQRGRRTGRSQGKPVAASALVYYPSGCCFTYRTEYHEMGQRAYCLVVNGADQTERAARSF